MLEINDKGQLEVRHELGDWGVPESMDVAPGWEKGYKNSIWYKDLAKEDPKLANAGFDEPLTSSKQVATTMAVLAQWKNSKVPLSAIQACAIANWLGGSWKWVGWQLTSTASSDQKICAINPQSLVSEPLACGTSSNIGDALIQLKKVSQYAHGWVVAKAIARAKNQGMKAKVHEDQAHMKAMMVPINAVAKVGEGIVKAVEGVGEGLKNVGETAGFLAKYGIYIAGGVGALWLYWQYRKLKTMQDLASGKGGLGGMMLGMQKNPRTQTQHPNLGRNRR
jgi:hypothetical protein